MTAYSALFEIDPVLELPAQAVVQRSNRRKKLPLFLSLGAMALVALMALIGFAYVAGWMGGGTVSHAATLQVSLPPAATGGDPKLNPLNFLTSNPADLRAVSHEDAIRINAGVPVATRDLMPAKSLIVPLADPASYLRSVDCMTAAIYYEAATEPRDGQRAVAQVILNRVRHPAYPSTVCGVVFQGSERATGCQFSFTCDGSLARAPSPALWTAARSVAVAALGGQVYAPVGLSTHYHADYVVPYWASEMVKSAVIGRHIFYRFNGGWGRPAEFRMAYAGVEPNLMSRTVDGRVIATFAATAAGTTTDGTPMVAAAARPVLDNDGGALAGPAAQTDGAPKIAAISPATGHPAHPAMAMAAGRWIIGVGGDTSAPAKAATE